MERNNTWNYTTSRDCCLTFDFEAKQESTLMTGNLMTGNLGMLHTQTSAIGAVTLNIPIAAWETERGLLITAINNRTRERNYANICLQLAEGQISEDEFEKEIMDNENRYVISFRDKTTSEEILIASQLTEKILDVNTEDDFQELFSINSASISKMLENKHE